MRSSTPIAITPYQPIYPIAQPPSQCSLTSSASQISSLGFFLLFLLMTYLCFKRWGRKRYKQQEIDHHQQQIECLERIWKIKTHPEL